MRDYVIFTFRFFIRIFTRSVLFPAPPLHSCWQVRGRKRGYDDVIQIRHAPPAIGANCPEGRFSWLEVFEPVKGWVLDTEIERSPSPEQQVSGPPSWRVGSVTVTQGGVTEASRWIYAVVCEDGALVRSGLDLSSSHTYTLRMHALVEVCVSNRRCHVITRLPPFFPLHQDISHSYATAEIENPFERPSVSYPHTYRTIYKYFYAVIKCVTFQDNALSTKNREHIFGTVAPSLDSVGCILEAHTLSRTTFFFRVAMI